VLTVERKKDHEKKNVPADIGLPPKRLPETLKPQDFLVQIQKQLPTENYPIGDSQAIFPPKDWDTASMSGSPQNKSTTKKLPNSGEKEEKSSEKLTIEFNRRILQDEYLVKLFDAFEEEKMISGNAFTMVLQDLMKLKQLCYTIMESYREGRHNEVKDLFGIMERVL
jgi:hypothetical protein